MDRRIKVGDKVKVPKQKTIILNNYCSFDKLKENIPSAFKLPYWEVHALDSKNPLFVIFYFQEDRCFYSTHFHEDNLELYFEDEPEYQNYEEWIEE